MTAALAPAVCGTGGYLPTALVPAAVALEKHPGWAASTDVERRLRCTLETHHRGAHHGLVLELAGVDTGSVWTTWTADQPPGTLTVLPDCPALEGGDGREPCCGYAGHPGGHTFQLRDPLDEFSHALTYQ